MKRKKNIKRLFGYSMIMGTTGLIAGKLPVSAKVPVQTVATIGSNFVSPMSSVTGAGIVVKQLKNLNPKKMKGRYK